MFPWFRNGRCTICPIFLLTMIYGRSARYCSSSCVYTFRHGEIMSVDFYTLNICNLSSGLKILCIIGCSILCIGCHWFISFVFVLLFNTGKGNKRLLVNNDEIALAMPKNKGKYHKYSLMYALNQPWYYCHVSWDVKLTCPRLRGPHPFTCLMLRKA